MRKSYLSSMSLGVGLDVLDVVLRDLDVGLDEPDVPLDGQDVLLPLLRRSEDLLQQRLHPVVLPTVLRRGGGG